MRKHLTTRDVLQDHVQIGIVLQAATAGTKMNGTRKRKEERKKKRKEKETDRKKRGRGKEKREQTQHWLELSA